MDSECSYLDYSFINLGTTESLLSTSQYAKVIFHNIEEKYDFNHDLVCNYSLTKQFGAQTGDRIVLFKLGWQEVTDYVLFEWISMTEETTSLQVCFKAVNLPRDENEFYQLCYISGENTVCGASIPFQFTKLNDHLVTTSVNSEYFIALEMDSVKTTNELSNSLTESKLIEVVESSTTSMTAEETNTIDPNPSNSSLLLNENKQLRHEIHETNASIENCNCQINELKDEIDQLKRMLYVTQTDVSDLKIRMDIANDEYKKLYAEKMRTEKKYEKLVKKCHATTKGKRNSDESSCGDLSSDFLGELEPLPPFPILM